MSNPIRMCIVCRNRFPQAQLIRLQYKDSVLKCHQGAGRSFYLCSSCKETPKASDSIAKICKLDKKHKENIKFALKEIFLYG
ncbi:MULTISPECIES: DUF448 domain-containing protein [Helicobacter]|mgnify:CR=1 FL=1|uniref:DUF448 domain-containing protein n=1 Tax=Helicobacter ganmani TaxID=60246 RepID=A0A3D8IDY4_9HELI|nr:MULTISPECIES: DUF448 domain-containing protein [Helicobacter]RDU63379.1 DUF448 domain-containing protein [Helicobacter ganmani]